MGFAVVTGIRSRRSGRLKSSSFQRISGSHIEESSTKATARPGQELAGAAGLPGNGLAAGASDRRIEFVCAKAQGESECVVVLQG